MKTQQQSLVLLPWPAFLVSELRDSPPARSLPSFAPCSFLSLIMIPLAFLMGDIWLKCCTFMWLNNHISQIQKQTFGLTSTHNGQENKTLTKSGSLEDLEHLYVKCCTVSVPPMPTKSKTVRATVRQGALHGYSVLSKSAQDPIQGLSSSTI